MKTSLKKVKALFLEKKQPIITTTLLGCLVLGYQNCQDESGYYKAIAGSRAVLEDPTIDPQVGGEVTPGVDEVEVPAKDVDEEEDDVSLCEDGKSTDNLICNPLSENPSKPQDPTADKPSVPKRRLGLIAKIFEGKPNWDYLENYAKGYEHPERVYFSNFDVPTRAFDQGFSVGEDFLKDQKGNKLFEWFSLSARGNITLPENEEEGYFHIMTLSDDGILVKVDGQEIVKNTYKHGATYNCGSQLIHLKKGEEKKFELDYFQGPRYHIALVTYIKRIEDPSKFKTRGCEFESGYKVISPAYFTLPDDV